MMLKLAVHIALVLSLALGGSLPARADLVQLTENQVKAAYLYNFAKFVEWPAAAFPSQATPLVVGIIGKGPLGEAQEALSGRIAKGRKVQVRHVTRTDEIAGCHILFIAGSEKGRLKEILKALPGGGILTVSDIKHFCDSGGMIGLVSRGDKLQFEVNLGNAERAGLRLSSQMLKLAVTIVE